MQKILYKFIACLLIPSFVFAQPYPYRSNENSIKQTDLARAWNALNSEVGQQIVSYIETAVGSIDFEHAKAFTTANGEVAFVPIKSFSKMLAALCYRQLEDGTEYLFLITHNEKKTGVVFTFPSGQMYVAKSSGVTESINPDFQFQQYDDLRNKISISSGGSDFSQLIIIMCVPYCLTVTTVFYLAALFVEIVCFGCDGLSMLILSFLLAISFVAVAPVLLIFTIYTAYPSNPDLKLISKLFALYYYFCLVTYPGYDLSYSSCFSFSSQQADTPE